jgi:type I restriction enzyme M protein
LVDRTRKEFTDGDVAKIAATYHAWRAGKNYKDVPGFCRPAKLDEIMSRHYVLTPGRYVGSAHVEDDNAPFAERFAVLQAKLGEQFAEAEKLTATIREKLARNCVSNASSTLVMAIARRITSLVARGPSS